jgi:hypothetical protein
LDEFDEENTLRKFIRDEFFEIGISEMEKHLEKI